MDETPRSSFIPKQGAGMIPTTVRKRKRFYVFGFVGSVVLVGTLLLAVGTYFYKGRAISKLESEKVALSQEEGKFDEAQILEVRQFEKKLNAAKYLLNNHIAPSKILDALHAATLVPVQLTTFSLEQRPSQDVTVTISGGTEAFRVVALQEFALEANPVLKNAILTELNSGGEVSASETSSGDVVPALDHSLTFSFVSDIDASLLAFDGTVPTKSQIGVPATLSADATPSISQ